MSPRQSQFQILAQEPERQTPGPAFLTSAGIGQDGVDHHIMPRLLARLGVRRVDANDGRGLALRPDRPCVST